MKCRHHPDREAYITCQKMMFGYCRTCLEDRATCYDPDIYCKFRTQCIIWELRGRTERRARLAQEAS